MNIIRFTLRIIIMVLALNILVCANSIVFGEKVATYKATYVWGGAFIGDLY